MKTATTQFVRGPADTARMLAIGIAIDTRNDIAYGVQRNDVTGRLEPGYVPATWADRTGMLEEVHGVAHPDGSITPRADKVPQWRKAGAK